MKRIRWSLVSSAGTALAMALLLGISQAQAQFVCVGNATGAAVPANTADGAGATAGGGIGNVACGTNANAGGAGGTNTATGNSANASGTNSSNIAVGNNANATGNTVTPFDSINIAIGRLANASGDERECRDRWKCECERDRQR